MQIHTFFIFSSEEQFWKCHTKTNRLGLITAMAAGTIMVCKGTKDQVMAKGMPSDVPHFEGNIPVEVIQALPEGYARANVERLSQLYSSLGPGNAVSLLHSGKFHGGQQGARPRPKP